MTDTALASATIIQPNRETRLLADNGQVDGAVTPAAILALAQASDFQEIMPGLAALLAPLVSAILSGGGAYAGTLSLAQPTATRIYQRDTRAGSLFGKGVGTVGLSVTLSAAVTTLEYRLRDADAAGNPVRQDWSALSGAQPAGTAALSLSVPASAFRYLMDVRANGDTPHAVLGNQPFGVGEVVAVAGQSLATNMLTAGYSPEGTIASAGVTPAPNGYVFAPSIASTDGNTSNPVAPNPTQWAVPADGTAYPSAFAAEFLRLVTGQTGVVAALVGFASGGSSITAWQPGQPFYASLLATLDQAGRFGALIWIQGHSDAQSSMGAATYQGLLGSLFGALAARYTGPGGAVGAFPRLVCSIPSLSGTYWGQPAQITAIRAGALAYVASDARARYVPALDMTLSSDGTHPSQAGRAVMARDFYRAFMEQTGLLAARPGPRLTGATRASGSATVKLAIALGTGGTAMALVGTPANQFTVFPSGAASGALAISSLTVISSTEIDLTLAATPADNQALDVWYRLPGSDTASVTGSGVYDNAMDADGLTTGRQLQLAAAPITVAAIAGAGPGPINGLYVRNAPGSQLATSYSVPTSPNVFLGATIQVYAPDGSTPAQVAFAIGDSSTTAPAFGTADDGVNYRDYQDFEAATGGSSPPSYAVALNIYPNGHASGSSRVVYLWAFPKDGSGTYLPQCPLTNPDGSPFAITVSYQ